MTSRTLACVTLAIGPIERCLFCDHQRVLGVARGEAAICRDCLALFAEVIAMEDELSGPNDTPSALGCPFCGNARAHPLVLGPLMAGGEPARICGACIASAGSVTATE